MTTDLNLDAIEARANAALNSPTGQSYDAGVILSRDVPALVAEVRRLRESLRLADDDVALRWRERNEARAAIHLDWPCATIRVLDVRHDPSATTEGGAS